MSILCSVIIPYYNERDLILPVIEQIKKSSYASQIIIVDDGSNEISKKILSSISGITLLVHEKNLGKSKAMKTGLQNSIFDIVVFIDSDLRNFNHNHLNLLVDALTQGYYDMVIGEREKVFYPERIIGTSITLAGERAFKKSVLLKNLNLFEVDNFIIESAINKLFFRKYKVGLVLLKGVNQWWKTKKIGWIGFFLIIKWHFKYIKYLGIKEYIFQLKYAKKIAIINDEIF